MRQLGIVREIPADEPWWPDTARRLVAQFDDILRRVALISDADARGEILKTIGRADVPGAPAERYKVVSDALKAGAPADAILAQRVTQLEDMVGDLEGTVSGAEEAYGTLPAPEGTGGAPGRAGTAARFVMGSVALLCLVVVPLALD
jgi:hypothetical protein